MDEFVVKTSGITSILKAEGPCQATEKILERLSDDYPLLFPVGDTAIVYTKNIETKKMFRFLVKITTKPSVSVKWDREYGESDI